MSTLTLSRQVPAATREQQVPKAVAAWRDDLQARLDVLLGGIVDREQQMDARRRAGGLQKADEDVADLLARGTAAPRAGASAVVVHRSEWLRDRLARHLGEQGVEVVAQGEDGAVALAGALVAQPDVLVIEGLLPWITPADVMADVRKHCPETLVVVLVDNVAAAERMLDAGADAVYSRSVTPAGVAEAVSRVLQQRRALEAVPQPA